MSPKHATMMMKPREALVRSLHSMSADKQKNKDEAKTKYQDRKQQPTVLPPPTCSCNKLNDSFCSNKFRQQHLKILSLHVNYLSL